MVENRKGLCGCARILALRRQLGITREDQHHCSHCKAIGKNIKWEEQWFVESCWKKPLSESLTRKKPFKMKKFETPLCLEPGCCWTVTQAVLRTPLSHSSSSFLCILDHPLKKAQSTSHRRIFEEFASAPSSCISLNSCERTASSSMCCLNLHHTTKHLF